MTDHSENRTTVWMSDDLLEAMDERIDWKYESKSQYVRESVQFRVTLEKTLERRGMELPGDEDERQELIDDIAIAGVTSLSMADGD